LSIITCLAFAAKHHLPCLCCQTSPALPLLSIITCQTLTPLFILCSLFQAEANRAKQVERDAARAEREKARRLAEVPKTAEEIAGEIGCK
jgi:hypothetical protein